MQDAILGEQGEAAGTVDSRGGQGPGILTGESISATRHSTMPPLSSTALLSNLIPSPLQGEHGSLHTAVVCHEGQSFISGELFDCLQEGAARPAGKYQLKGVGETALYQLLKPDT